MSHDGAQLPGVTLGPCEVKHSLMRRVLRVITAATVSSLMCKVSTFAEAIALAVTAQLTQAAAAAAAA